MKTCICCNSQSFSNKYPNNNELWTFDDIRYEFDVCNNCQLLEANPLPNATTLDKVYSQFYTYQWFEWNAPLKKIQAKHRLSKIAKQLHKGQKLLDFGCGHGYLVNEAARKGIKSYGFDFGIDNIIQSDTHILTYGNDFEAYQETDFDVITLWHVLEHVIDPNQIVNQLKKRLKKGGKLIISVPNSDSLGFKICKEKWSWCQQPFVHVHHYNSKNLRIILENNGLITLYTKTYDTWDGNIYDIIMQKIFFKKRPRGSIAINYEQKVNVVMIADSIIRLFFTPFSYLLNFLRGKTYTKGAELMIVSEKLD